MMRDSNVQEVTLVDFESENDISNQTIVTYTKSGEPLSRFGDDIWDYSATSRGIKTINFTTKIKSASIENEDHNHAIVFMKTFTLQWLSIIGGCSISKLYGDLNALGYLISGCLTKGICAEFVFSTPDALDFLVQNNASEKQTGLYLAKIQRFTDTSIVMNKHNYWERLNPSQAFLKKLKILRRTFPETTECAKTLLIPSSIYQAVLKSTMEDLDLFIQHSDKIKYIFSMRTLVRDKGVSIDKKQSPSQLTTKQSGRLQFYWRKLLKEKPQVKTVLEELNHYGISKNAQWSGLVESLSNWQIKCAILIAGFTGMRKSEVLSIPFNGLKTLSSEDGEIPVICL